jgi:hypothetical protein
MIILEAGKDQDCAARSQCPAAPACPPLRPAPCEGIQHRHAAKLVLCDALERIADALPGPVDRHLCLTVAARLVPLVRDAQRYEEEAVFPLFAIDDQRIASVRRLEAEHVEDETLAGDLTESLLSIGHGARIENSEALGFMLRAFFEALRRHIAFEREHVVPLFRQPRA